MDEPDIDLSRLASVAALAKRIARAWDSGRSLNIPDEDLKEDSVSACGESEDSFDDIVCGPLRSRREAAKKVPMSSSRHCPKKLQTRTRRHC